MDSSKTTGLNGRDQLLKCECVKCGSRISFPAQAAGLEVNCPHCRGLTVLTANTPVPDAVKTLRSGFLRPKGADVNRYGAKNTAKPVNFYCDAPDARHVSLVGDFNNWDPKADPMKRRMDGSWFVQVELHHGHHHYLLWVDGELKLDPRAQGVSRAEKNQRVSMIAVS
ncbi:MAG: hypothetical protein HY300_07235 [Verrucomicrobia bacterium]|nr:hypothetical protein [Verrucomicrobiota bacterium]